MDLRDEEWINQTFGALRPGVIFGHRSGTTGADCWFFLVSYLTMAVSRWPSTMEASGRAFSGAFATRVAASFTAVSLSQLLYIGRSFSRFCIIIQSNYLDLSNHVFLSALRLNHCPQLPPSTPYSSPHPTVPTTPNDAQLSHAK